MALLGLGAMVGLVALVLHRVPRTAAWCVAIGGALFATLYGMGRLGIVWPDPGPRAVFLLNPYLFLTLSYVLVAGGTVALVVRWARRWLGRPPG